MSMIVDVAVAVIFNDKNQVCISLRNIESHQGGLWEFPGGKIESGETVAMALARECKEELNLHVKSSRPLITVKHHYLDKSVCLHVHRILSYDGVAEGMEGQQVKWVSLENLSNYDFPVANLAILKAIDLPERYLITGGFDDVDDFKDKLVIALRNGIELVQLRVKTELDNIEELISTAIKLCREHNVRLLVNIPTEISKKYNLEIDECDGVHADSKRLMSLSERPQCKLFSASCHNEKELVHALKLNVDFVVLSPVQVTKSHPDMKPLGWEQFSKMIEQVSVPVYALGGVNEQDIETSWAHGAQGVAAISAFW